MFGWLTRRTARRTEKYFCAAVSAAAYHGDDHALVAAWLAASQVDPGTRETYIGYVARVAEAIRAGKPDTELGSKAEQMLWELIAAMIRGPIRDGLIGEILREQDFECWQSYGTRSTKIFHRRHPDLVVQSMTDVQRSKLQAEVSRTVPS